ncbi:reverse transcriptase domain-containing protein [Tanacetum coccineum]
MLKFPVEGGTVTLQSSRIIPRECAMISGPSIQPTVASPVPEEKINIAIHPEYPEQTVAIGSTLTEKGRKDYVHLLKQNLDFLPGSHSGFDGRPRKHRWTLLVHTGKEIFTRQARNEDRHERNKAIKKNMTELGECAWTSKILTMHVPKTGYHQIKMAKEDEEKMAFITSQGIFCYSKMSFGLKNAGSTYQRLVDKAFQRQIGRNLEVYVDDLVIKSRTEEEIIRDITETFKTLRQINMKLNPKKCTFGMQEGMFLGYKVSTNGLKACPDKADAVLSLPSEISLQKLPTLTAPREREELIYIAAAKEAISAVLMTDREGGSANFELRDMTSNTDQGPQSKAKYWDFIVERPEDESPDELMAEPEHYRSRGHCSQAARPLHSSTAAPGRDGPILEQSKNTIQKALRNYIKQIHEVKQGRDALSKIASTSFAHLNKQVLVEELKEKSINEKEILDVVQEEGNTWMTPIREYLTKEILPEDKKKARAVRRKAVRYAMINGTLYKKSFLGPWLRCVGPLQANYVLREIHEGSCSMHSGPRSVVAKAIQTGYYWPTMHMDARK